MFKPKNWQIPLVALACWFLMTDVAHAQDKSNDQLCRLLFDTYICRKLKTNTKTLKAASHIIAERGRTNGFWRVVLQELETNKSENEVLLVQILGAMLASDTSARGRMSAAAKGFPIQQFDPPRLDSSVIETLIERSRQVDFRLVDHYVIAISRAEMQSSRGYFLSILRADDKLTYKEVSKKFHAAIALARLGDAEGLEWLISNTDKRVGGVRNYRPLGAKSGGLDSCCQETLSQLSRLKRDTDKETWRKWAATISSPADFSGKILFVDR